MLSIKKMLGLDHLVTNSKYLKNLAVVWIYACFQKSLSSILFWITNVSSLFGEDTFYWPGWKHFKGVVVSHKLYGFAFFHTRWKDPLFLRKIEGQAEILIHVNPWQTPSLVMLMGCCSICIFFPVERGLVIIEVYVLKLSL